MVNKIMDYISFAFIFVLAVAFLLVIFVFLRSSHRKLSDKDQRFFIVKWQEISNIAQKEPRTSILEADKLLDRLLSKKGYSGSLGDKLKKAETLFTDLNGVWYAHKMRNRIAHEIDFIASFSDTERALSFFKRAMRDLGVKF